MIVTGQDITATENYLSDAFSKYRRFEIDYSLPSTPPQITDIEKTCSEANDWEHTWSYTWSPGQLSWTWTHSSGGTSVTANAYAKPTLGVTAYVGWNFHHGLQWFKAYMQLSSSVSTSAYVTATGAYSNTWSRHVADYSHRFCFWVDWVPVYAYFKLKVDVGITVNIQGQITASYGATATGSFTAGVQWQRGSGWSGIDSHSWGFSQSGPSITGSASMTATPNATCRLEFLFYDVAGPYVELTPYAITTIAYPARTWQICLWFKVRAGVTFAGWLRNLLNLNDYSWTVGDWNLHCWNGNW
jgi:hypothetical protein